MDASDLAVVARVRAGDRETFRVLVERHSRSAFRLACRLTGHEQDAEDIVQETFLKAFRQFGRVELARKETDPAMKKRIVERLSLMRSKDATDYMMEIIGK